MNWIAESVVIFVTAIVVIGGPAWWMGRHSKHVPVERLADETPFPYELPRAGFLPVSQYGPFPADTGPLLILSEKDAANAALELEIREMGEAAERKIGPVQ